MTVVFTIYKLADAEIKNKGQVFTGPFRLILTRWLLCLQDGFFRFIFRQVECCWTGTNNPKVTGSCRCYVL